MPEMVLPGTYIEVRAEGLITPGRVSVGNIGMVGTANRGPVDAPVAIGSYAEAKEIFGSYDAWIDGNSGELTLVRALEIAYSHGATTVFAVRIADGEAAATHVLTAASGDTVRLAAKSPGTWGNDLKVRVLAAEEAAFIADESHPGPTVTLDHTNIQKSARNRIRLSSGGVIRSLAIIYDDTAAAPTGNQVKVIRTTGLLTFPATVTLSTSDTVTASYAVDPASAATVSIKHGNAEEKYTVVNGDDLVADLGSSALVSGTALGNSDGALALTADHASFGAGAGAIRGADGENADNTDYKEGLDLLLNENAHIIVGAGRDESFGDELNGHAQLASTDALRRDRIAVVGSALGATIDQLRGHNLDSDRVVYVAPGITFGDSAKGEDVVLPGGYAAAAVAGMLSSYEPHQSLTNKVLSVGGLESKYTPTQLTQLLQSRILALEVRQGFRVVRGITTSSNTAWTVITTRRIVDFAKAGVRSAATSYIGLLNNDRVRTALRSTIASFLNEMVDDEMLIAYELDVTAEREDQIKGIVKVTMSLQPTFSIEFIKVTMFLG